MSHLLPPAPELDELLVLVEARWGLGCHERQRDIAAHKVRRALRALGCADIATLRERLREGDDDAAAAVVAALTVGETYFLRNRAQFETLRHQVLPALESRLDPRKPVVFWSAGCATGEEPYSIAMWIAEHLPHLWPDRVRIVATDLNPRSLELARRSSYGEWSFRHVEPCWRGRYFHREGSSWVVAKAVREVVTFESHNLVSGELPSCLAPSSVHVVFCRNVLIYFRATAAARTLDLFARAMSTEGALFLGHAEAVPCAGRWRPEYFPGAFFYRSPDSAPPEPEARPPRHRPRARATPEPRPTISSHRPAAEPVSALLEEAERAADRGELERARQLLGEVVAREPTALKGHFLLAVVAEQQGDIELALAALTRALYLDQDLAVGHYLLAVLHERAGDEAGARRRYRNVQQLTSSVHDEAEVPLSAGLTSRCLRELAATRLQELEV